MRGKGKVESGKAEKETVGFDRPFAPGLYIHSPFCRRKCVYCDFNSYAGIEELIDPYVEALVLEIKSCNERQRHADSVYFGGGNPALLGTANLKLIMESIGERFTLDKKAEVTIEANPEGLYFKELTSWRRIGFNRLSLGSQSFDDDKLKMLGRLHTAGEAVKAFESARKAGFANINIDLIFGLPGQTVKDWERELKRAAALNPEHISAYGLTLEAGTPLYRAVNSGRLTIPDEDAQAEMMEIAAEYLTSTEPLHFPLSTCRYSHYEISNFARSGFECRHNLNYWQGGNYTGYGAGAHSHQDGHRWWNKNKPEEYIERLKLGASPKAGEERLTNRERVSETIFLGLRLVDGFSAAKLQNKFELKLTDIFAAELDDLTNTGLLSAGERWALTDKGRLLANDVMARFV